MKLYLTGKHGRKKKDKMTYREAIKLGESILQKADITDAKNDAWLLLAMACKIDRTYYYVHMDE